jgi:hypothetical protein
MPGHPPLGTLQPGPEVGQRRGHTVALHCMMIDARRAREELLDANEKAADPWQDQRLSNLVAGTGFEPVTFGL